LDTKSISPQESHADRRRAATPGKGQGIVSQDVGPYPLQAAIVALHASASRPQDTSWKNIDLLYQSLELLQPLPVATLNRAVALWKW